MTGWDLDRQRKGKKKGILGIRKSIPQVKVWGGEQF